MRCRADSGGGRLDHALQPLQRRRPVALHALGYLRVGQLVVLHGDCRLVRPFGGQSDLDGATIGPVQPD